MARTPSTPPKTTQSATPGRRWELPPGWVWWWAYCWPVADAQMSEDTPGPATNLLRSLVHLGGTLLALLQARVDLLTTELSEDLERGLQILLWAFTALLCGILGALLLGVSLIIYFWDTHRLAAALSVTGVFLAVAVWAGAILRRRLHEKPRLLDASRTELHRDVELLRRDR
ncbi:MAG: phage holin family protein [Gammaproteobacteria bacterium]|nr:phage holin family protein [Gammaproteobacteria bacterium]